MRFPMRMILTGCLIPMWGWAGGDAMSSSWGKWGGLSLRGHLGYNIEADFKGLGGLPHRNNPGPAVGGQIDRVYDNGFVRVDVSENAGNQTWNWGYDSTEQIDESADQLVMTSLSAPGSARSGNVHDAPYPGAELVYRHPLVRRRSFQIGLETGLGWTRLDVSDDRTLYGDAVRTVDRFELGGIIPPAAPYQGTFEGPGPVIGTVPHRSLEALPDRVRISGNREIDGDLFAFRLGPVAKYAFNEMCSVTVSGGAVLAWANSRFSYHERVELVAGQYSVARRGHDRDSELLGGGYIEGAAHIGVTDQISMTGGARLQSLGTFSQSADEKEATLDLGESIFVFAGMEFEF